MRLCGKLDTCMPYGIRRILGMLFGVTEMLFFGGIMYGFTALFPVLKKELIFADLCKNKTSPLGCPEQTTMYANALTTYSVSQMVMLIVIGVLIDQIGLRSVKIGSACVYFLGTLMFAFTTPAVSPIIFVAGVFTACGGIGMLICNLSISQMFINSLVLVIALITGSFDTSAALFAIVSKTYEAGISFQTTFLILGFTGLAMGIFSALFILTNKLPTMNSLKPITENDDFLNLEEFEVESITKSDWDIEKEDSDFETKVEDIFWKMYPTRKKALKSLPFWMSTSFFCFSLLRFTFFLAQITPGSLDHFNDPLISDNLGQVLSISLGAGIFGGFLCGFTIDKLRSNIRPKVEQLLTQERTSVTNEAIQWLRLRPNAIGMLISAINSLILSVLVFIPNINVYYANFVFLVVLRGFMFSTFSSSIMAAFPVAQFGTLYGIGGAIGGIFSCLQYGILLPTPVIGNGIALAISVCIFIPSTVILIKSILMNKKALAEGASSDLYFTS